MPDANNTVITDYRKERLCKITAGTIAAIAPIAKIAFGDGGANAQGEPVPPSGAQTALVHELGRYDIDGMTHPHPNVARYTITLPEAVLPGATINEAALVDADGELCAIKTMLSKGKDPGAAFLFVFDDTF